MQRILTTIEEFLKLKTFKIPAYQRNYSWENKQLSDLWNDLYYLSENKNHFFGTILVKKTGEKTKIGKLTTLDVYEIIDGQQRIITIIILLNEILEQVKSKIIPSLEEEEREELLKEVEEHKKEYIKYNGYYSLKLLNDDAEFYNRYIVDGEEFPENINTSSRRRLKSAKKFFQKRLEEKYNYFIDNFKDAKERYSNFLLSLINKIKNAEIIQYTVEQEADAILIFQTVNDRGKELSNLEKIKSFIMHKIYLSEPDDVKPLWDHINIIFANIFKSIEQIQNTSRGSKLNEDQILRYFSMIYNEKCREDPNNYFDKLKKFVEDLYKRNSTECREYVVRFAKELEKAFHIIREITTYSENNEINSWLERIYQLGRPTNFYTLIIAYWIKFGNNSDCPKKRSIDCKLEVLRFIETYIFRVYSIGKRRTDAGEKEIRRLAYNFYHGNIEHYDVLKSLLRLTLEFEDDVSFRFKLEQPFFYKQIGTRDIKYLLLEYEKHLRKQIREELGVDERAILSSSFSIEHIWPQTPSEEINNINLYEEYVHRLGNLTIASQQWNARWGNMQFSQKKRYYNQSVLLIQRNLSNKEKWNEETIDERTNEIVNFAIQRWSIDNLKAVLPQEMTLTEDEEYEDEEYEDEEYEDEEYEDEEYEDEEYEDEEYEDEEYEDEEYDLLKLSRDELWRLAEKNLSLVRALTEKQFGIRYDYAVWTHIIVQDILKRRGDFESYFNEEEWKSDSIDLLSLSRHGIWMLAIYERKLLTEMAIKQLKIKPKILKTIPNNAVVTFAKTVLKEVDKQKRSK